MTFRQTIESQENELHISDVKEPEAMNPYKISMTVPDPPRDHKGPSAGWAAGVRSWVLDNRSLYPRYLTRDV